MGSETKVTFSAHELVYLHDTDFLLTKRIISDKVQALLLQLAAELAKEPAPISLPPVRTKVSKGENYRGLPYWVLDYPAVFNGNNIFAYRTICRWGHGFSFTLHLAGEYLDRFKIVLAKNYDYLASLDGLYLCVNTGPWEHHFGKDNYRLFEEVIPDAVAWKVFLEGKTFVKLAFQAPLDEWEFVKDKGVATWRIFNHMFLPTA